MAILIIMIPVAVVIWPEIRHRRVPAWPAHGDGHTDRFDNPAGRRSSVRGDEHRRLHLQRDGPVLLGLHRRRGRRATARRVCPGTRIVDSTYGPRVEGGPGPEQSAEYCGQRAEERADVDYHRRGRDGGGLDIDRLECPERTVRPRWARRHWRASRRRWPNSVTARTSRPGS